MFHLHCQALVFHFLIITFCKHEKYWDVNTKFLQSNCDFLIFFAEQKKIYFATVKLTI